MKKNNRPEMLFDTFLITEEATAFVYVRKSKSHENRLSFAEKQNEYNFAAEKTATCEEIVSDI